MRTCSVYSSYYYSQQLKKKKNGMPHYKTSALKLQVAFD